MTGRLPHEPVVWANPEPSRDEGPLPICFTVRVSNLVLRLLTAGLVAPVLLWVIFFGPAWAWYLLVAVTVVLGSIELFGMTHSRDRIAQAVHVLSTLAVSVALYAGGSDVRVWATVLLAVPMIGILIPVWRLGEIETAGLRQMTGIGGPLYVGVLLTTVALLRKNLGEDGPGYVALTLMFAWLGDTGAYFAGRFLGRTKLHPRISPAKTRAGFVGALGGAGLSALLAHFWFLPSLPLGHALGLAVVAGGMGQIGDLAESLLKRAFGLKDSGKLLPGHGGILDRIDALMITGPIVYLYTLWAAPAP